MSQRLVPHLVATCLLFVACPPLTAADAPAVSKDGPFRVELPDGASIELVGVSEPPPGERGWWRPDGSPLAIAPGGNGASSLQPFENSIVRRFAVYVITDGKADVHEPGPQGPGRRLVCTVLRPDNKGTRRQQASGEAPVHRCDAPGLTHIDRREVRGRSLEDTCVGGSEGGRQFRL